MLTYNGLRYDNHYTGETIMQLPTVTALQNTCVLNTPSPLINEAFRFAKDNIARCMRYYTLGWGMSNFPIQYARVVGRDTGWMVIGTDYVAPWFAAEALKVFRDRQKPNGQILEFIDLETGEYDDYGLNVADNTPFYLWATCHHWEQFHHPAFHADFLTSVKAAADYLLNEMGPDDLLVSVPAGVGMQGLTTWRNIISDKATPGEVTEINALSALALHMTAAFTGDERYAAGARRIAEAIDRYLWHRGNYLLYRDRGVPNPQITGDTVFPLICDLASDSQRLQVLQRLAAPDFWTDRGLRTVPNTDAEYNPMSDFGLLGGSWPNLTLWYAAAVARHEPLRAVDALERVARPVVEKLDPQMNVNLKEFAEYFHGETNVNRGMHLSPWVAPTFIWSVMEGLLGLTWHAGHAHFAPHLPEAWHEVTVTNMPCAVGAIDVILRPDHSPEIHVRSA
jgi:glycogen debranching enzyme